jgi:hypothetical protein
LIQVSSTSPSSSIDSEEAAFEFYPSELGTHDEVDLPRSAASKPWWREWNSITPLQQTQQLQALADNAPFFAVFARKKDGLPVYTVALLSAVNNQNAEK